MQLCTRAPFRHLALLGALALACLSAATGHSLAQTVTTASLKGRITDENGDGMPGVLITLTNQAAALAPQTVVTDIEGNYAFRLLPPSSGFQLTAAIPTYATVVAGPIDLQAGRATVQNLALRPAAELEETIRVEARGEIVDIAKTTSSTSFNSEFIAGLPLIGRQFADLLTLASGVSDTDGDGNPNVRGSRDTGLQVRLDGSDATDPLSGHFSQEINLDIIDEVEIITSGAPAEYGRADGGFASVITKSGGNELQGSLKFYFRSNKLDGDGAGNTDGFLDRTAAPVKPLAFTDLRVNLAAGGPIIKDRLWYFGSINRFDREEPVKFPEGGSGLRTLEGWQWFAKMTLQADTSNRLTFQVNSDPLSHGGNFIGTLISPDTDFILHTGGPLAQVKWTSIISPSLLLETLVSHQSAGESIEPVSPYWHPIEVKLTSTIATVVAAALPCETINCAGDRSIYRVQQGPVVGGGGGRTNETTGVAGNQANFPGPTSGAFPVRTDDSRERTTFRADLSLTLEEYVGEHSIKSGFEFKDERYENLPIINPVLIDETHDWSGEPGYTGLPLPAETRWGDLFVNIFDPIQPTLRAEALGASAYVQDAWKPRPNLTLSVGLRFDHEEIETHGFEPFDPLAETREMLRRFDLLCATIGHSCEVNRLPGRITKGLPGTIAVATLPATHPAHEFDVNHDGTIDLSASSPDYRYYVAPITTYAERFTTAYTIANTNLAPRLSLSWDPWADGKTKVFATWNRYYDRLNLNAATVEQLPNQYSAVWSANGPNQQVAPGAPSFPLSDILSVDQADHNLRTPYTDEWSLGLERELAPEWAVNFTWVSRRGKDLLQDTDVNHITCSQFGALGAAPYDVCGDGGVLEIDRFGRWAVDTITGETLNVRLPNGAPDLYVLNPEFNRILRVANLNASQYDSAEIALRKRLHRNWQMQFSYTWSEARGDAESFSSATGNDPAVNEKSSGYLDFDQRHVIKWQGVLRLPGSVSLGGTVQWASGLPWSIISTVEDVDDANNLSASRTFFPFTTKNDQRNSGQWTINARLEKELAIGSTIVSAFLSGENLIDADDLTIKCLDLGQGADPTATPQFGRHSTVNSCGANASAGLTGERRFGRRWELGASISF